LPRSLGEDEARRIAYFSLLLDGFQHFYGQLYAGDYSRMAEDLKERSVFLNRILGVASNQTRWEHLKKIYYGDFDSAFIAAIDSLFEHEMRDRAKEATAGNGLSAADQL